MWDDSEYGELWSAEKRQGRSTGRVWQGRSFGQSAQTGRGWTGFAGFHDPNTTALAYLSVALDDDLEGDPSAEHSHFDMHQSPGARQQTPNRGHASGPSTSLVYSSNYNQNMLPSPGPSVASNTLYGSNLYKRSTGSTGQLEPQPPRQLPRRVTYAFSETAFDSDETDAARSLDILQDLPSRNTVKGTTVSRRQRQRTPLLFGEAAVGGEITPNPSAVPPTFSSKPVGSYEDRTLHNERSQMRLAKRRLERQQQRSQRQQRRSNIAQMQRQLTYSQRVQFRLQTAGKQAKAGFKDFIFNLGLWRSSLKKVEGNFGNGVVSYFIFLRWLVLLDLLLVLLWLCFVVGPQIIDGTRTKRGEITSHHVVSDDGWYSYFQSSITGGGYLEDRELFCGTYTNKTLTNGYSMPIAYILTAGVFFFASFLLIIMNLAKLYQESFELEHDSKTFLWTFFNKVFSAWDFTITEGHPAKMKMISIKRDLEEELAYIHAEAEKWSFRRYRKAYWKRFKVNCVILILLVGAGGLIYYTTTVSRKAREDRLLNSTASVPEKLSYATSLSLFGREMAASLTISVVNLFLPTVFSWLALKEMWRTPRDEVRWTLFRTVFLRLASLGVLMASIFAEIDSCTTQAGGQQKESCKQLCWETLAGQEIYSLAIVDFILVLIATGIGETLWRYSSQRYYWVKELFGPPEFDVSKGVLELIYSQALLWLGTFYCPALPLITLLKLFVFFYAKKASLLHNLQPSTRPYRAKNSKTFRFILLLAFFATLIPVGYSIVKVTPSARCGPFRGKGKMYDVIAEKIREGPPGLSAAINFIGSIGFFVPLLILMLTVVYYNRTVTKAQHGNIKLLHSQLVLSGRDKRFLVDQLQKLQDRVQKQEERNNRTWRNSGTADWRGTQTQIRTLNTERNRH